MELTDDQLLQMTDEQAEAAQLSDELRERRLALIAERNSGGGGNEPVEEPSPTEVSISNLPPLENVWSNELVSILTDAPAGDTVSDSVQFTYQAGPLTFNQAYIAEHVGIPVLVDDLKGIACTPFGYALKSALSDRLALTSAMTASELMYFIQLAKTWA